MLRLAAILGQPVQLAEKVIAMNRLSNELGSAVTGGGRTAVASPTVLRAVAGKDMVITIITLYFFSFSCCFWLVL